jgi:glycine cleavage system aminomethyltransferase T
MEKQETNTAWGQETEKESLPLAVYAPFDSGADYYVYSRVQGLGFGCAVPYEYTNWRDEVMSWKETCYIHAGLNPAPTFRIKGPDTVKFLSTVSVNSFARFPVGSIKHCIMCNDAGLIMTHGVLLRLAEDEVLSFFLAPYAAYKLITGNYDAKGEFITDQFIFQVAGPRSLETLESAAGECLHDIKFARHRPGRINGIDVRILRVGMAGTLAYEIHGKIKDAKAVYNAISAAGKAFGIRKLGFHAYQLSHTEDGFPQGFMHFPYPWADDKGFMDFLKMPAWSPPLLGSMGPEINLRYRNPVELGWGNAVRFDHDFIGREALEKEKANPRRAMVTLEWNREDILDVVASLLQPGEHYMPMSTSHFGQEQGHGVLYADQVLKDGRLIGISSGRNYSYYYRQMISLCSIDTEYRALGTEVSVLWGNPGTRQKEIRAVVSRFPYLNENRNEDVDVSAIPCRIHE